MESFKSKMQENNKRIFYEYFLEGDQMTSYVIEGLGENIILGEEQLKQMLLQGKVEFEFIDTYKEFSYLMFNNMPITIKIL